MALSTISKAIAAGAGGALGATGINFAVLPQVFPDGVTAPWWAYVLIYAIGIALPTLVTWRAPKNAD